MFGIKRKNRATIDPTWISTSICQLLRADDTTDNVETTDEIGIRRWARMALG